MRVVICLGERIDPAAARALWRLLFSPTPDTRQPSQTPPPREHEPVGQPGDREATP